MSDLLVTVVTVAALSLAITLAVVLTARWRAKSNDAADIGAAPTDLGLVRFVAVLAIVVAIITAGFTLFGVVATLAGQEVAVDIPVVSQVPQLPSGVTDVVGPTAQVVGGASQLTLTVRDLSFGTRFLLAGQQLAGGATFVVIALLVRRLARSAIASDAFRGSASRAIGATAAVLAVGSFAANLLGQIGGWAAGVEALQIDGYAASGSAGDLISATDARGLEVFGWPEPSLALTFEFTPLLIALALGCVAAIFREGERLRIRAEAAEADVAGLV